MPKIEWRRRGSSYEARVGNQLIAEVNVEVVRIGGLRLGNLGGQYIVVEADREGGLSRIGYRTLEHAKQAVEDKWYAANGERYGIMLRNS